MFEALETNVQGCSLMDGLVAIHRGNPDLAESDAYFSMTLRAGIRDHRPRRTWAIANLFTGGVRMAFEDWIDAGQPHLTFVADRVGQFLIGPVQDAYNALLAQPTSKNDSRISRRR